MRRKSETEEKLKRNCILWLFGENGIEGAERAREKADYATESRSKASA